MLLKTGIKRLRYSEGSVLVLVLIILTAVTVVCALILGATLFQVKRIRIQIRKTQARYTAEAAVYKTVLSLSGRRLPDSWKGGMETMILFDGDTAVVETSAWGGFVKVDSRAVHRKAAVRVRALLGQKPTEAFQNAVVCGSDYPLVVAGRNRIVGDVLAGMAGMETGYIAGRGFEGSRQVEGKVLKTSLPRMPDFKGILLDKYFTGVGNPAAQPGNMDVFYIPSRPDESLFIEHRNQCLAASGDVVIEDVGSGKPFKGPVTVRSSGNIFIKGVSRFSGYVEFVAAKSIFIEGRADLHRVLLSAGQHVDISGSSRIEGQIMAVDSITVRGRSTLEYPSVLYCRNGIFIRDGAFMAGTVIQQNPSVPVRGGGSPLIRIHRGAKVTGAVYGANRVWLEGTVWGTACAGLFYLFQAPTAYNNYLMDATIDRMQRPDSFLLPLQFGEKPDLDVLFWEYLRES
jgi:hypothetical protein